MKKHLVLVLLCSCLLACKEVSPLNNPHREADVRTLTRFSVFSAPPKTLDPARSYSADESVFVSQIYEPPLQYHYLKRPYQLEPLTAAELPRIDYFDKSHKRLPADTNLGDIHTVTYTITIKPHIQYQPHPAFAKNKQGKGLYFDLSKAQVTAYSDLSDFKNTQTRELTAADYVYQIKRLANPTLNCPIAGLMAKHIVGFADFSKQLSQQQTKTHHWIDLRLLPMRGVRVLSRYQYQITLTGPYPQFMYWLALSFFAPMPWEAERFYSNPQLREHNLTLDWHPVGTGPYQLIENNPNQRMVLSKNPNFHEESYPEMGGPGDANAGLLQDAGKRLPFLKQIIFTLERESIPVWNKFFQGYYDLSSISSDSFDEAIQLDSRGKPHLTDTLEDKHITLYTTTEPSLFYLGFNMQDPIVGGQSERAKYLRQAISIALDYNEFIALFLNGRGIAAQGPIPPGMFAYDISDYNPIVFRRTEIGLKRQSITVAKALLSKAGYPNGRDPKTQAPLVLNYDATSTGAASDKARFDWLRKQFSKLGIQLVIRATQYSRFQEKMRTGHTQLFFWGWSADYPDPENFLFLFASKNGKVLHGGENATNYHNTDYDKLFERMQYLANTEKRSSIIRKMVALLREDAPVVFAFYPKTFLLSQVWNRNIKPNAIARNTLKYASLDPKMRLQLQDKWNRAQWSPIIVLLGLFFCLIGLLVAHYYYALYRLPRRVS